MRYLKKLFYFLMTGIKKNKQKNMRDKKNSRSTPLLLPRDPREAKKLAEINAMLENAIFYLPAKGMS